MATRGHEGLATWLAERLHQSGLSQRELAKIAGIAHSSVGRVLDPRGSVSFEVCLKIANALRENPVTMMEIAGLLPRSHPDTYAERQTLHLFMKLDDAQRAYVLDFMRFLLQN